MMMMMMVLNRSGLKATLHACLRMWPLCMQQACMMQRPVSMAWCQLNVIPPK
uniref:Uncharacterized protein n=1 Tax=Arundo donax TaxID=35708 RepID=A0A0A9EYA9_ARUDO